MIKPLHDYVVLHIEGGLESSAGEIILIDSAKDFKYGTALAVNNGSDLKVNKMYLIRKHAGFETGDKDIIIVAEEDVLCEVKK